MLNDIPIIKAFTHNGEFYIYDTYLNVILKVDILLYRGILRMTEIGVNSYYKSPPNAEKGKIELLIDRGFFKSNIIEEVIHFENDYIESLIDRCLGYLQLQVTCDCNFLCRYCFFC